MVRTTYRPLRSHYHSCKQVMVPAAIVDPVGATARRPTLELSRRNLVVDRSNGNAILLNTPRGQPRGSAFTDYVDSCD